MNVLLGVPAGIVFTNGMEWLIHKYWLHERGRDRASFWSFHWHDHHNAARRLRMGDPDYSDGGVLKSGFKWNARTKEAAGLLAGAISMTPLLFFIPGFVVGVWGMQLYYYYVHKRSHVDPEWGHKHLRWHVDHHLGPNQDANWCVTFPLWDYILGTRERYVGTEREARDRARWEERRAAIPA